MRTRLAPRREPIARHVPPYRFDPIRVDPLFAWLARHGVGTGWILLVAGTAVIALLASAAWIDGNLGDRGDLGTAAVSLSMLLTSVPGVSDTFWRAHEAPDYPLLADAASAVVAMTGVLTVTLVYRQWNVMRTVVSELIDRGALEVENPERFRSVLGFVNQAMASRWTPAALLMLALTSASLVWVGAAEVGLYSSFASGRTSARPWAEAAYDGWWAAAQSDSPAGFVALFVIGVVYLYYVLAQNFVGIMWVIFTWKCGAHARFRFDLTNMDGYFGWRPLRALMTTVYFSILIHAMALLALLQLMPLEAATYIVAPFLLFVLCSPLYVLTPWLRVSPRLRRERTRLQRALTRAPTAGAESGALAPIGQFAEIADAHAFLRSIPTFPFRMREVALGAVTYGIPAGAAVLQSFLLMAG